MDSRRAGRCRPVSMLGLATWMVTKIFSLVYTLKMMGGDEHCFGVHPENDGLAKSGRDDFQSMHISGGTSRGNL
jgi:hypothetical protein